MRYADFKIVEMAALKSASSKTSMDAYLDILNKQLSQPKPPVLVIEPKSGVHWNFQPDAGQGGKIKTKNDMITGKGTDHNGKEQTQVPAGNVFKSDEYKAKGRTDDAGLQKFIFKRGEVAEGVHAAAAFARLIERPSKDITLDLVRKIIMQLKNSTPLVRKAQEVKSELADEFVIILTLKPQDFAKLQDPRIFEDPTFSKITADIISDANKESARYADIYSKNGKFDKVSVIGDGVSGEATTKSDIEFENETETKKIGYSIKAGTTDQIDQVYGGGPKSSPEERFEKLQDVLFGGYGQHRIADISTIKNDYVQLAQKGELNRAQELAYKTAAESMNTMLDKDRSERVFLKNLIDLCKIFMRRDDPTVLLKQFTGTGKGTIILDAEKLDDLIKDENVNLVAKYVAKSAPYIEILDSVSGKMLIEIRTKYETDSTTGQVVRIRNIINKKTLFKDIARVRAEK